MAGKLGGLSPRTQLEYLLWQRDQTYDEVVAEFAKLARTLGEPATLTSRHLRRLASGERNGVTPVTRRVLQAMFSRPADDLLAPYGHSGDLVPVHTRAGRTQAHSDNTRGDADIGSATRPEVCPARRTDGPG